MQRDEFVNSLTTLSRLNTHLCFSLRLLQVMTEALISVMPLVISDRAQKLWPSTLQLRGKQFNSLLSNTRAPVHVHDASGS